MDARSLPAREGRGRGPRSSGRAFPGGAARQQATDGGVAMGHLYKSPVAPEAEGGPGKSLTLRARKLVSSCSPVGHELAERFGANKWMLSA